MVITCRELARVLGVDYLQASSVMKVLIKSGVASVSDNVKSGGRGRPTIEYKVPSTVTINLETGQVD